IGKCCCLFLGLQEVRSNAPRPDEFLLGYGFRS
ncbi:CDC27 isoform 19, partial [Pan troglodytes]